MWEQPETWAQLLAGAVLVFFGRRLFWLCLAITGFLLTFTVFSRLHLDVDDRWMLLISLALGVLGALLAVLLQKVAVAIAGFAFGFYAAFFVLDEYGLDFGDLDWVLALAGGLLVGLLATTLFDTALIVLSSLLGAGLIASALVLDPVPTTVLLICLALLGIATQIKGRHRATAKAALGR